MTDNPRGEEPGQGVRTRTVEAVVAAAIFGFGLLVAYESYRLGTGWGDEGPQAGYFPFYVGLIICLSSAWTLLRALRARGGARDARFATGGQLKLVLAVLLPSILFVAAIYVIGLYAAAALFLAVFMRRHGRFGPGTVAAVSIGVPAALFFMFDIWFLVPLPKGPIESLFGY